MAPKPLAIARNWAEHGTLARVLLAGLSSARSAIASVLMRGWLNAFPSSALIALRRVRTRLQIQF
jgi:hypothetical protein